MSSENHVEAQTEKSRSESQPLVSIIVLTYRRFEYIYETLKTVVAQEYPNIELVISDDGSEIFPADEISQWLAKHGGKNIRAHIRQNRRNVGTVANANIAASGTKGEYVMYLPPGDGLSNPRSLLWLVSEARRRNALVLTSCSIVCKDSFQNTCYQYPRKKYRRILIHGKPEKILEVMLSANVLSAIGTIYARAFFDEGGFDEKYTYLDDWPTWLSILQSGRQIDFLNKVTTFYMLGGISSESGSAFESPLLREDLIRCMEDKILPYIKNLSLFKREIVKYRYLQLCSPNHPCTQPAMLIVGLGFQIKKCGKHLLIQLKSQLHKRKD